MRERKFSDRAGFTLVEILIAIMISGFILAALYTAFVAQQRSYFVNQRVTEMQENLRAAVMRMSQDIRMAGYDPTGTAGPGILIALPYRFRFQQDITNDTGATWTSDGDYDDANENVTYGFSDAASTGVDQDDNGIADSGAGDLGRATGTADPPSGFQDIAENIEAIGFAYDYVDSNGQIVTGSGGNPQWAVDGGSGPDGSGQLTLNLDTDGDGLLTPSDKHSGTQLTGNPISPAVDFDRIRAVRVYILARSSKPARNFTDTTTYVVGRNIITPTGKDASYHHRLLVTTIECRNMGL